MKIPGFIDLQVNGFLGIDFSDEALTEEDAVKACSALLERGTAAFLPTLITSTEEVYGKNLPMLARIMDMSEFKNRLLGFHVEGPFISAEPGAVGAHNPEWVRKPDVDFLKKLIDWAEGKIRLLTIAAEPKGADKLARFAASQGITVALGHQMALEDDVAILADAGATCSTHLTNGLPNMINRHRNPIWASLGEDRLSTLVITDSHHVPASVIKVIYRVKGIDRFIVTSDAAPLAGFPPGRYHVLGNDAVIEENGLLHNPEKGCMVGSSATMIQCMNHLASLDLMGMEEMLRAGFYNPLKLINIDPEVIPSHCEVLYDHGSHEFIIS